MKQSWFHKLLLKVHVLELHKSMVIPLEEVGINKAKNAEKNIISSDSTLRNTLPPQLKNISAWYKLMCVFCLVYPPKILIHMNYYGAIVIRKS